MTELIPTRVAIPAALLGVVAAIYVTGRALGLITLVGYKSQHQVQWGIAHESSSEPGLGTPVVLKPGEALAVDYRVKAPAGSLALRVSAPGAGLLPAAYAYIPGEQSGRLLFVAQERGLHGYSAEPTSIHGGTACSGGSIGDHILPERACPTFDVDYTVSWRWVSADDVASSGAPQIAVPPRGAKSVHHRL